MIIEKLRTLEDLTVMLQKQLFEVRRMAEAVKMLEMKQGQRITPKPFTLACEDCGKEQLKEETYYLHLRVDHNYSDDKAAELTTAPRRKHEDLLAELTELLDLLTEATLQEEDTI